MSTQIINFDKINELENFRNKIDSMMISHEIRINNNIKDIQDIKFKYDRQITENLTVPGFVGPSCKYKTISSYISSNIDEISKMKIENEVYKKDNKELRKKVDDIIKTCLNLVDNTNSKFLQYVDTKTKNLEESFNMKLGGFTEKIIDFKSLIMTQKNAKEIQSTLMEELQNNNFTKKEKCISRDAQSINCK
jgi:HAMP domain-containing protein